MKDATIKLWQSFMENVIGPLVKNEKLVLALFILAPEEAPVAATVDDLPYADHDHDKYSLRKHAHGEYALHTHGHEQKDWTPIIKQAIRESAEELYDKYHK